MRRNGSGEMVSGTTDSAATKGHDIFSNAALIESAFDLYYDLGTDRTINAVARQLRIPFETVKQWHEAYAWDEKIHEINKDVELALEEHYRSKTKDIRNRLVTHMEMLLDQMDSSSFGLPFAVTNVGDLRSLSQAYESLVRANTLALTRPSELANKTPTTWADLLKGAETEAEVDLDGAH